MRPNLTGFKHCGRIDAVTPVLNNDRDGGSDNDQLTVTKAATPNNAVLITGHGSLTLVPKSGFVGFATTTYTIGQGGFSIATAVVLVTPNIHVTPPGAPNTPQQQLAALPSNTGISAEGAVLAAAHDAGGINNAGGGITVRGIIDSHPLHRHRAARIRLLCQSAWDHSFPV